MGSVLAAVEKSGRVHSASPAASSGPPAPPLGTWYVAPGFGLCGQCGLLPFGLMILFDLSFVILCDIRMGKACMHVGFMVIDDFPLWASLHAGRALTPCHTGHTADQA